MIHNSWHGLDTLLHTGSYSGHSTQGAICSFNIPPPKKRVKGYSVTECCFFTRLWWQLYWSLYEMHGETHSNSIYLCGLTSVGEMPPENNGAHFRDHIDHWFFSWHGNDIWLPALFGYGFIRPVNHLEKKNKVLQNQKAHDIDMLSFSIEILHASPIDFNTAVASLGPKQDSVIYWPVLFLQDPW